MKTVQAYANDHGDLIISGIEKTGQFKMNVEGEEIVRLRPRHQPGHVALDLAANETPAVIHRPRHVQRHGLHHQGRQTRSHLSRSGIGQKPDRHRDGSETQRVGKTLSTRREDR